MVLDGAISRQDGADLVAGFLDSTGRGDLPSAVVACNDAVAIGAMESLFAQDPRAPGDVRRGYDDIYLASPPPRPPHHRAPGQVPHRPDAATVSCRARRQRGARRTPFLIKPKTLIVGFLQGARQ